MSTSHRLIITDRGRGWAHRYAPSCTCGQWNGVPRRKRDGCEGQYRQHRDEPRVPTDAPRELTPVDSLPEALRVA